MVDLIKLANQGRCSVLVKEQGSLFVCAEKLQEAVELVFATHDIMLSRYADNTQLAEMYANIELYSLCEPELPFSYPYDRITTLGPTLVDVLQVQPLSAFDPPSAPPLLDAFSMCGGGAHRPMMTDSPMGYMPPEEEHNGWAVPSSLSEMLSPAFTGLPDIAGLPRSAYDAFDQELATPDTVAHSHFSSPLIQDSDMWASFDYNWSAEPDDMPLEECISILNSVQKQPAGSASSPHLSPQHIAGECSEGDDIPPAIVIELNWQSSRPAKGTKRKSKFSRTHEKEQRAMSSMQAVDDEEALSASPSPTQARGIPALSDRPVHPLPCRATRSSGSSLPTISAPMSLTPVASSSTHAEQRSCSSGRTE
ncbi:hypothetical protein BN946_scf184824.g2 [Trametes cinnabarina]|uniref:Uncharacterized protein n=1 Tax=Pycnoporus cinnabarinus TaxID=5643 RepID=A0A060SNC1_PYCCI|nr:hypothetical protein BN946_scf184824.g2 [Trametes cinnabarina]